LYPRFLFSSVVYGERAFTDKTSRTFATKIQPETLRANAVKLTMPPVSRRAVLAGAALTTAALIVPITVRRSRAAERDDGYEITDWIVIGPSGEVTHRVRGAAAGCA